MFDLSRLNRCPIVIHATSEIRHSLHVLEYLKRHVTTNNSHLNMVELFSRSSWGNVYVSIYFKYVKIEWTWARATSWSLKHDHKDSLNGCVAVLQICSKTGCLLFSLFKTNWRFGVVLLSFKTARVRNRGTLKLSALEKCKVGGKLLCLISVLFSHCTRIYLPMYNAQNNT